MERKLTEYRTERGVFYNGDCQEGMATFPDKHFDIAIVDPPYGIGNFNMVNGGSAKKKINRKKNNTYMDVQWNNNIPNKLYFLEIYRISINQIIWGANYYNCFSNGGGGIVWYKKIGHPNLSDCEIASISFQKKVDFVHIDWQSGFSRVQREGNVIHPCQKPVALYKWLVKNYVKQGQRILDTHVGSASSLIAYEDAGLEYVGYELDSDYYAAAVKRIKDHKAQLSMFPAGIN